MSYYYIFNLGYRVSIVPIGSLEVGRQLVYRVAIYGNWLRQMLLKKLRLKLNFEIFEQSVFSEV